MPLKTVLLHSPLDLNLVRFRAGLIKELKARGVAVHAAVPKGEHLGELQSMGAETHELSMIRGGLNPLALRRASRDLARVVREVGPDILHSFTHQANLTARLALGYCQNGVPLVNSVTGLGALALGTGLKGWLLRRALRLLYRRTADRCRALVFQNPDDQRFFAEAGLPGRARVELIPGSGVDLRRFSPNSHSPEQILAARQGLGLGADNLVLTMAARLVADKGVREFLHAARALAKTCPQARFLLAGETDPANPAGLSDQELEGLRREKNIIFAGWRRDMDLVWALSDVAVLPSYREGLPVSLQEAAAAGLAIVTTDAPGCRELATGPHGREAAILVPVADGPALANALEELALDDVRRKSMGRAARKKAEADYDQALLAARIMDLYHSLV